MINCHLTTYKKDLEKIHLKIQLPADLRARMTLVVRRVPAQLLEPGVAAEALKKEHPELRVLDHWIGPKQKMMKITCSSPGEAKKLKDSGIRMSMYSLTDIEYDLYVDLGECLWCYRLQEHNTSKCPHRKTEFCSICGQEGHRYTVCPRDSSVRDTCLNCTRLGRPNGHRTRSGDCRYRKEVLNHLRDRARAKDAAASVPPPPFTGAPTPSGRASYSAAVAPTSSTRREAAVPAHEPGSDDQLLVFQAMWVGTLADASTPGSFGRALEATLRKNGLPAIKVPDGLVDGGKILARMGVGIPVPERPGGPPPSSGVARASERSGGPPPPSGVAGVFPALTKPVPAKPKAPKPDAGRKATVPQSKADKAAVKQVVVPASVSETAVKPKVPASAVKPKAAVERKDSDPTESNSVVEPRSSAPAEVDPSTTNPSPEGPASGAPLNPPPKRKRKNKKRKQTNTAQPQTNTCIPPPPTPSYINLPLTLDPEQQDTQPSSLPSLPKDSQQSPQSPRETTKVTHPVTDSHTFSHSDTDSTHDTLSSNSRSSSCSSHRSTCSSGSATLSSPSRMNSPSPVRGNPSPHPSPPRSRDPTPPPSLPSPVFPPTPLLISSALSPHTSTPNPDPNHILPSLTPLSPIGPSSEDSVDLTVVDSCEAQADGADRFSPIASRLSRTRSKNATATPRRPSSGAGKAGRGKSGRRNPSQPLLNIDDKE